MNLNNLNVRSCTEFHLDETMNLLFGVGKQDFRFLDSKKNIRPKANNMFIDFSIGTIKPKKRLPPYETTSF
jgi:hypothetical protein